MADRFGRAQRSELRARRERPPGGKPREHARCVEVARARQVHHGLDRRGRGMVGLLTGHDHRAVLAHGHRCQRAFVARRRDRRVEIRGLVERPDLRLVGEQDIDRAVADEAEEFVAEPVDAKRVR